MATETAEAPVYLYDTLAPLGEEAFQDEASHSPSSSGFTFTDTGPQTLSQTVTELSTSTLTSTTTLQSSIISSASVTVEDSMTTDSQEILGTTSASPVTELKHGAASSDQELVEDMETFFSQTTETMVKTVKVEATVIPPASEEEDFDFLSLDVDDLGDGSLAAQAVLAEEEKVMMSDIRSSAAQEAPPWARTGRSPDAWFRSPFLQLHQEIVDFCNFVAPTEEEKQLRAAAVQRVSEVVKSIWPSCQVKVFGSFATGLFLPTSDCDVVILDSGCQVPQNGLKAIAKALNRKSLVKHLLVIGKARVPIVKFVERESNISFDISFDVANGPDAADFIRDAMAALPPLKPLCLVLKIFLQQRELNEVYTGGIGSYALLVMLLTHLQMHPSRRNTNSRGDPSPLESNLGILLVDFFDFYGRALNVREVGISCRSGGRFYTKSSRGFLDSGRPYLLAVEDPQSPDNDIGKNSYNVTKVRSAFLLAHRLLTKLEVEGVPAHVGLLGRIVRMDAKLTGRKSTLPELPHRLKLAGKDSSGGNSSSAALRSGAEMYITGTSHGSRWQDHEGDDFPRGGEREQRSSRKRKHGKEREHRGQGDGNSHNLHHENKRKRGERGEPSSGKGKKSRHGKDSLGLTAVDSPSSNPSQYSEQDETERPGSSDRKGSNGKISKQHKSRRRSMNADEDLVVTGRRTPDGKKNRWRKQSRLQKEDSHEEGEIILKDDFAELGAEDDDQPKEDETASGAGNGHNKHKRWFNDGKPPKPGRARPDRRASSPEGEDEVVGRSKVVITTPAHKKTKHP